MRTFFFLLIVLVFTSCSNEDTNFFTPSNQFIDSNVQFAQIDTFSFSMSTFKLDSLITNLNTKILVGQYTDAYFGKVTCSAFADFVPSTYYIEDDAVFDSIVLNMKYSSYYYSDTLVQKTIKVHTLSKEIRDDYNESYLYNTRDYPVLNQIGERTFYPRIAQDSLKITLNEDFGSDLFYKIRDNQINSIEELPQFFKGLKISPGETEDASIIGIDLSGVYLRFYYSNSDDVGEVKYYDFIYNSNSVKNKYFTQVLGDRTGTVFPEFVNQRTELLPQNANNLTYVQSGTGILTKFAFPNFKEGYQNIERSGTIYKANLKIPLDINLSSAKHFINDSLQVYLIDQNNNVLRTLQDNAGRNIVARVKRENPELNEVYLTLQIESYLERKLSVTAYQNYSLALIPFDFNSSTTRMLLNSRESAGKKSKLTVTYVLYED